MKYQTNLKLESWDKEKFEDNLRDEIFNCFISQGFVVMASFRCKNKCKDCCLREPIVIPLRSSSEKKKLQHTLERLEFQIKNMQMDGGVTEFHDLKVVKNFGCPDFILFYKEQLGVDKK